MVPYIFLKCFEPATFQMLSKIIWTRTIIVGSDNLHNFLILFFHGLLKTQLYFLKLFFIFLSHIFYCCPSTVISISPTSLPLPTLAIPTSHPSNYPPLALSICTLYMFLYLTLTLLFPNIPSPLPSDYCQSDHCFHVSYSILLLRLFCWLGSTYRWDHMVFEFHCLAYVS